MTAVDITSPGGPGAVHRDLVTVSDLVKHYPITKGLLRRSSGMVRAVDGVSFTIGRGETVGLVGESGCGKSTIARLVTRLVDATAGTVTFDGVDITKLGPKQLKPFRRRIQLVFQDPFSSLNPRMRIVDIVAEPLRAHGMADGREGRRRVCELIELVGLSPRDVDKYPHQFSGGQAQRIGIARALATSPDLIVLDEAVSSLDVSIQAQILNLLRSLQAELDVSYLFIAHDLNVVRYIADRVLVMYLGRIVEVGGGDEVMRTPAHPYSQALAAALSVQDRSPGGTRVAIAGEVPSPSSPPSGCHFHTRCGEAFDRCSREYPVLHALQEGRFAACHLREGEAQDA